MSNSEFHKGMTQTEPQVIRRLGFGSATPVSPREHMV